MAKRSALLVTFALIFNNGLPLLTFPLLTKTFDIHSYGIWIEANTLISLITFLGAHGLANAVGLILATEIQGKDRIYANALYTFLVVTGGLFLVVVFMAPALNALTMRSDLGLLMLQILAPQIVFAGLNGLAFQIYRMQQRILRGTIIDTLVNIARLIAVFIAIATQDLIGLAVTYISLHALISLVQIFILFRDTKWIRPDWEMIKQLIGSSVNLTAVSQSNWLVMYGDRLLLSVLASSATVALYAASYQLTSIINALGYPYLYALLPQLSEAWKRQDYPGMQHTIRTQINSIALIIVPAAFGLVAVGIPLLSVLATTEFAQSTILIALIVGGISIDVFSTALQYIFYAQGRSDILRNIYLQAAVFNILANLIAIPLFSYNGAGLTTLLTFVYIFFALWRKTEMPFTALFDVSTIGRCLLAAIVMAGVVSLLVEATIPRLLVAMCVGGLTYGVGIILLRVVSVHDLLAIPRALRHRLKR